MAKFIELESLSNGDSIIINVNHIGHFYEIEAKESDFFPQPHHTKVGVTTHNNGGFEVVETIQEILKLINN